MSTADASELRAWRVVGKVQGVSFRWFTRRAAQELGISGWVRNLPDGSVEVRARGDASALDQLLEAIKRGPARSRVERVEAQPWNEAREPEGLFEIKF